MTAFALTVFELKLIFSAFIWATIFIALMCILAQRAADKDKDK